MITNLEIYKFKDWEVDINKISNLFNLFDECLKVLEENKIEYAITGSLGLILISNKIYRNIGDIDFVIKTPFFNEQIHKFLKKNFFHISSDFRRVIFEKNQIRIEFHTELQNINDGFMNNTKIKYQNYLIDIVPIQNIFLSKKMLYPIDDRKKDLDDIEFYKHI